MLHQVCRASTPKPSVAKITFLAICHCHTLKAPLHGGNYKTLASGPDSPIRVDGLTRRLVLLRRFLNPIQTAADSLVHDARITRITMMLLAALCVFILAGGSIASAGTLPTFAENVQPILEANCLVCHGADAPQQGLDLRTAPAILRGGNSGPAIEIGASTKSLLVERIVAGTMPPGDARLAEGEIEVIRRWIDEGAGQEAGVLGLNLVTEADVLPILQARCVVCHGKSKQSGGLDLRTQASRLAGGESGPAIVPGKPDESLLIRKVDSGLLHPSAKMQYDHAVRNPTEAEMTVLRQWVATGCPPAPEVAVGRIEIGEDDKNFWAFVPPVRAPVPAVKREELVRNPIDAFLLRKLEAHGMSYSPEAEPHELLRRAHLDLTGMPPTPQQTREYLEDSSADRYERLIDRLLNSPEYGERWARHWLDVAGYNEVESTSTVAPTRKHAWRYRDYVVRSLNADKSFDRFLTEQIAGDEIAPWKEQPITAELVDRLAATGYLRTANDPTWEIEFAFLGERMDVLADQVQILGSGLMGLTIGCARCHDHKYDPISQQDFYSMAAILQSAYDPYDWKPPQDRALPIVPAEEKAAADQHNDPLKAEIAKLEKALEEQAAPYRKQLFDERLEALPEAVRDDLRVVKDTPKEELTEVQQYLAKQFRRTLDISIKDVFDRFEAFKPIGSPIREKLTELRGELKPEPKIRALTDMGGVPSTAYLLQRGNAMNPGRPVEPNTPVVASAHIQPYTPVKPAPEIDSSGYRLGLARWLTQPNHPLVTRVLVNRIWMRHFGRGIVATVDNFGKLGEKPTHPELLDWLAIELVEGGWTLKRMHRMIMTSQAFRQSSRKSRENMEADPDNSLVSRVALRRMDADQLYDSMLQVTGQLDPGRFGPPAELDKRESGEITVKPTDEGYRRSIYTLQQPLEPVTLLEAFDFPQMAPNCTMRSVSNVATQALQLMNSERTWELARYLSGRIVDDVGRDQKRQVDAVFQRALTRAPSEMEMRDSLVTLDTLEDSWLGRVREDRRETPSGSTASWLALANLCHTILNSAEFSFID